MPSTLKCPLEQYLRSFAASTTAAKNRSAISWSNSRRRFFENVEASKPRSSMRSPKNHLNNMSKLRRSQNARSERIEYSAISTEDFNNISGGTLGRPRGGYIAASSPSRSPSTASTTARIRRIG